MPQADVLLGFRLSADEVKALRLSAEIMEWLRKRSPIPLDSAENVFLKRMVHVLIDTADLETFNNN